MRRLIILLAISLTSCGEGDLYSAELARYQTICDKNDGIQRFYFENNLGVARIRFIYCKDGASFAVNPVQVSN